MYFTILCSKEVHKTYTQYSYDTICWIPDYNDVYCIRYYTKNVSVVKKNVSVVKNTSKYLTTMTCTVYVTALTFWRILYYSTLTFWRILCYTDILLYSLFRWRVGIQRIQQNVSVVKNVGIQRIQQNVSVCVVKNAGIQRIQQNVSVVKNVGIQRLQHFAVHDTALTFWRILYYTDTLLYSLPHADTWEFLRSSPPLRRLRAPAPRHRYKCL